MGIITAMFPAANWLVFSAKAQTWTVSGEQRGTWLLGAPLAYEISLLVLQTILHWLVSQSILLISLKIYNPSKVGTHQ
jgi:hypothetical protein